LKDRVRRHQHGEVTLRDEPPMHRSAESARRVALLTAAVVLMFAGCSSASQLSDDTLAPLPGAPTTLALGAESSSTTVGGAPAPVPSASTDASATSTTPGTPTTSTTPATSTSTLGTADAWGGWAYYEVPQLGTEPVRGSGCGANGGLGDVVPDGVWNVYIGDGTGADQFWSGGQISLDIRCVYAGDAGRAQWNTVCSGAPQSDACRSQSPDWFVVNANRRLRTMPVASNARYGVGAIGSTPCAGVSTDPTDQSAPWRSMDSWVVINGGVVTTVVAACPAG
jgi:hypothetical protein